METLIDDFNMDGRAFLKSMLVAKYGTVAQAYASATIFAHPDTVAATGCKPILQVIREGARRGQIAVIDGRKVGLDDTKAPTDVFCWIHGLMSRKIDIQFNHVYPGSRNPETYTCLANLCVTPSSLAKLTDHDREVRDLIRYRVDWPRWKSCSRSRPGARGSSPLIIAKSG
jgi:hypothetical protein